MLIEVLDKLRNETFEKGIQVGIQAGFQSGCRQGESRMLARLLRFRFDNLPDQIHAKLANATQAELEAWSDAVLTARTLDEVFATPVTGK